MNAGSTDQGYGSQENSGETYGPTRLERADSSDAKLYRAPKMAKRAPMARAAKSVTGARCRRSSRFGPLCRRNHSPQLSTALRQARLGRWLPILEIMITPNRYQGIDRYFCAIDSSPDLWPNQRVSTNLTGSRRRTSFTV